MSRDCINIVNGFKFIPGSNYMEGVGEDEYLEFKNFYDNQVKVDPYAPVRDRAMIKIVYERSTGVIRADSNQSYFQSYSNNEMDGGKVRVFPPIEESIIRNRLFGHIFRHDTKYIDDYCDRLGKQESNISVHFVRYKADQGGASYSSPIWLHLDDEPLVFVHLIQLTENAIGGDNIISEMDSKPKHVLRLCNSLDTLVLDRAKKHAVTPLGSTAGMAFRDIMLINLENETQQK